MDDILAVFFSWQFLLIGIIVYFVFGFFNDFLGPRLWKIAKIRKVLKAIEGVKMIFPPAWGFALGWIPMIPRPEPLKDANQLTVALLYLVAGIACQWIVKGVKKALEARGIDVDLDLSPKDQRKQPRS